MSDYQLAMLPVEIFARDDLTAAAKPVYVAI